MHDLPTPAPSTREHVEAAKKELEEALKNPAATKRLKRAAPHIIRDLESDVRRVELGGSMNGNGAHP